jgi:hypothetical protein
MNRDEFFKASSKAIQAYADARMSERVKTLIAIAGADLFYGPISSDDIAEEHPNFQWPGFSESIDEIVRELREAIPSVLYFSEVFETVQEEEPSLCDGHCVNDEGEAEEFACPHDFPEDWTAYSRASVLDIVLGKELASYCR